VEVAGDFIVGGSLTAAVGSFGLEPASVTFDWYRDAARIAQAHEATYVLRPADAGHQVTVAVTAWRDGVVPLTVTSVPTPAIAPGTMTAGTVRIAGGARVGVRLKAEPSGFGPLKPTKYSYQWFRNGKPIKGATSKTYLVVDKDVKKRLTVQVTASRRAFTDTAVTSAKTRKIPKRPKWVDPRCMTGRVICIDTNPKDRKVRWVVNGKVKMTFAARFGAQATPTRHGVYRVYLKSRNHTSTLYDSWMPFAMFYSGGQAVHYSPDFAARGYSGASHGCVNIRNKKGVAKLFDKVKVGTKVVVYS
jgi:lipoprotein-anchoring transpeptidase ErfK/SrfK